MGMMGYPYAAAWGKPVGGGGMDPVTLQAIAMGVNTIGNIIGSGRTAAQKRADKLMPQYEKQLTQGVTLNDVGDSQALALKAALPTINAVSASAGAKYGRSGYTRGAGISKAVSMLSPAMLAMLRERLSNNQANLRTVYNANAQIAAS